MTVEYAYDHNGLRTQKKVTQGSTVMTTDYQLHGKLITHMKQGSNELHFFYDGNSRPAMVKYNGALYTYVHNLQGDIVAILDSAGTKVVEYKYDAWGKPLSTTGSAAGSLGELNPFRYRGYVYDTETGLYYLRSRFYDFSWARFISTDTDISTVLFEANQFVYCSNNPVIFRDETGNFPVPTKDDKKIHDEVCKAIAARGDGWGTEVRILGLDYVPWRISTYGVLDVYNSNTNEYYEVKKSTIPIGIASRQIERYKEGKLEKNEVQPMPGRYIAGGWLMYKHYLVHYYWVARGEIRYDISDLATHQYAFSPSPRSEREYKRQQSRGERALREEAPVYAVSVGLVAVAFMALRGGGMHTKLIREAY